MSELPEDSPAAGTDPHWLPSRTNRFLVAALLGVAVALAAGLIFGPKPWDDALDFSREAKERIRTHSFAVKGLWLAAVINLVFIAVALAAWFFRPKEMCDLGLASSSGKTHRSFRGERVVLLSLVAAAIVLSGFMMGPRLGLSLWGDEEATARRFVIGNIYQRDDGSRVLVAPNWERTLWNWDNGPNSHMLFNVLSRLSHGPANVSPDDPDRFYFDERRIRLPSFIATLFMIAAAAWLTTLLGFPRGAPLVAFLLALHPWVIRYGTEARGYALMMTFVPLAACLLLKALRSRRPISWWIAFGLCEFLLLYSHLSAIYFLLPLNLAGIWLAWSPFAPGHQNPFRVANVWRLAAANLLGAVVSIQLMLPNLLQFPHWLKISLHQGSPPGRAWIEDWLSFWSSGIPWHSWEASNPHNLTLQSDVSGQPIATGTALVLLGLLLLTGILALLQKRRHRVWLLPLVLPVPLMILGAHRSDSLLYPWYPVGFLPLAAVVIGMGFDLLAKASFRLPKTIAWFLSIGAAATVLLLFAFITQPQRHLYRSRSVEPLAESVRATREIVNPFHPDIDKSLTLGFVHATQLYDPAMIYARTDQQFLAAVQRAEDTGLSLWVNAANLNLGRPVFPKAFELLDDRAVFEEPEVIYGLQVPCTRYLFHYKPGGLAKSKP